MVKKLIYSLMFLIIISIVAAGTTDLIVDPKENHVLPGENAVFTLTITNTDIDDKTYTITPTDLNWLGDTESLFVPAQSTRDITLTFEPLSDLTAKNYGINLVIESTRDKIETFLPVKLLKYNEVLRVSLTTADLIDPRKETIITLNIENKYRVNLQDLKVELITPAFKKELTTSLNYFETKNEELNVVFKEAQSGAYKVRVIIKSGNNILVDKDLEVEIAKVGALKEQITEKTSFLITDKTIRKINEGNSRAQELYKIEMNLPQLWFTKYDPKPDTIETVDKKYVASWSLDIAPKETFIIRSKKDYLTPLIILIVVLLIIYGIYNWKIKSIAISKKALVIHSGKESATIKVVISLRNRTNRVIKNLRVTDRIHHVIKDPSDITLKPTKTGKAGVTTALFWDIPLLGRRQEKLISYRVECRLHERLTLPEATVRFEDKGKGVKASAGSITIRSK